MEDEKEKRVPAVSTCTKDEENDEEKHIKNTTNCSTIIINSQCSLKSIEPQFIVSVTHNGNKGKSLIDTGASCCFMATGYAAQIIKSIPELKLTLLKDKMNIRLGDNRVHSVTHSLTLEVKIHDRKCLTNFLIMPLPKGIDSILGLDFQTENQVLLDTAHRRVLFLDDLSKAAAGGIKVLDGDSITVLNVEIPLKSNITSLKNELGKVYSCSAHEDPESDVQIVSHNTMNRYLKLVQQGNLSFMHTENSVQSLLNAQCHTDDKHNIIEEHVLKRGLSSSQPQPNKCFKASPWLKSAQGNTSGQIFSKKKVSAKMSSSGIDYPSGKSSENSWEQPDYVNQFLNRPKENDVWLAHVHVGQNGDVSYQLPGSEFDTIKRDSKIETAEENRTKWKQKYESLNRIQVESKFDTCKQKFNREADFKKMQSHLKENHDTEVRPKASPKNQLPDCPLNPSEINATVPEHKEWVDKLIAGKIEHFKCAQPVKFFQPLASDEPMDLELKEGAKIPPPQKYRCPNNLLPEFKKFILEMLEKGWIEPAKDAMYAAPILIIKKPGTYEDGSSKGFRYVSDMRAINSAVKKMHHPIPDISEMWEHLKGAKFISVVDMKSGYYNAAITDNAKKYLTMDSPWGTFSYRCVPQGFVNSSFYFQRWVERKLRKHGLLHEPVRIDAKGMHQTGTFSSQSKGSDAINPETGKKYAPGESQPEMDMSWAGCCANYQDDIIIFSKDAKSHKHDIIRVLRALSVENVPLNIKKSQFFCRYCRVLGAVVGQDNIYTDPQKIDSIVKMVVDKNIASVRGFLGITGFYRKWIPAFAAVAKPLTDLLKGGDVNSKKKVDLTARWTPEVDIAINELKKLMISFPVLRLPDTNIKFTIASDASNYAVGAVLGQKIDGKMVAIAYFSTTLKGPELNYSAQEKEALGLIKAVKKFDHYIRAAPFTVRLLTDHQSLQFMKNQKGLAGRMARWAMILSEYDAEVLYLKGTSNTVADSLSRLINTDPEDFDRTESLLHLNPAVIPLVQHFIQSQCKSAEPLDPHVAGDNYLSPDYNIPPEEPHELVLFQMYNTRVTAKIEITSDDYLKCKDFGNIFRALSPEFKNKMSKSDFASVENRLPHFFIDGGLLYYTEKTGEVIAVPSGENRTKIIRECHVTALAGHRGEKGTFRLVRIRAYWPRLTESIKQYIKHCEECITCKSERRKPAGKLQPLDTPWTSQTHYSMDFKTDLPPSGARLFDTLLVSVDRFSKRVILIPTWKNATSQLTPELFFERVVCQLGRGVPISIVSDRDAKFTCNFWRTLWALTGTELKFSTSRHQSTDGQSEIAIRIIEEVLRMSVNYGQDNWVSIIPALEFALNNSVSESTGLTPFITETGKQPLIPLDLTSASLKQQRKGPIAAADSFLERITANQTRARDSLELAKQNMRKYADQRRRTGEELTLGSKCWLKLEGIDLDIFKKRPCAKLNPLWYGPLEVLEKISAVSYRLLLPEKCRIHDVFHIDRLKPHDSSDGSSNPSRSRALGATKDIEYEVEKILDEKCNKKGEKIQFLVHWKGYSQLYDSSWVPEGELMRSAKDAVKDWRKKHPQKKL